MGHRLASGVYIDPAGGKVTTSEFWAVWAPRQPWRAQTQDRAATIFKTHIGPAFGRRALASIRRGEVEDWARRLPLAPSTASLVANYLSALLNGAVADGLLSANPIARAKRPKVEQAPVVPLSGDEVDALLDAVPPWFKVAVVLGIGAGLRQGARVPNDPSCARHRGAGRPSP